MNKAKQQITMQKGDIFIILILTLSSCIYSGETVDIVLGAGSIERKCEIVDPIELSYEEALYKLYTTQETGIEMETQEQKICSKKVTGAHASSDFMTWLGGIWTVLTIFF